MSMSQHLLNAPDQALYDALNRFVWHPEKWLRQTGLSVNAPSLKQMDVQTIRRHVSEISKACDLPLALWRSPEAPGALRLALLSRDEWMRLGLVVSMLPMCGRAHGSIDGHFRRMVKQCLDQDGLEKLDHGFPSAQLTTRLGPGAWRNAAGVALGGVSAIIHQICDWPEAVSNRFSLAFEPGELNKPPSVVGLNSEWMEFACKISWPDHPWLCS
ncbi:hypothetical protein [Limnohabitans sp. 2KL-3]|uniref:hypothetical protein n=1 Tax=Limnohabitans sp. 2KL-3 TaxID=1100700 RepID=UPI00189299B4|nr:hypothetical protein [Limnohabitans sp. 2KL-3]